MKNVYKWKSLFLTINQANLYQDYENGDCDNDYDLDGNCDYDYFDEETKNMIKAGEAISNFVAIFNSLKVTFL